ncbi:MAG: hypothetical protein ACJAWR_001718, partial [Flavobacteriales bacterium]
QNFLNLKNGKGTHLIHYEKMTGLLGHIFMTKHYNLMNKSLKKQKHY